MRGIRDGGPLVAHASSAHRTAKRVAYSILHSPLEHVPARAYFEASAHAPDASTAAAGMSPCRNTTVRECNSAS